MTDTDAAVLWARISAMAAGVCANDPRSVGERRSDAAGAWGHGNEHLVCLCGSPACPAAQQPSKSNMVIRVIADPAAIEPRTPRNGPGQPAAAQPPHPRLTRPRPARPEVDTQPVSTAPRKDSGCRCSRHGKCHPLRPPRSAESQSAMPGLNPNRGIGPQPSSPNSSAHVICSAASLTVTCPPTAATSTTPLPGRWAPPIPRT